MSISFSVRVTNLYQNTEKWYEQWVPQSDSWDPNGTLKSKDATTGELWSKPGGTAQITIDPNKFTLYGDKVAYNGRLKFHYIQGGSTTEWTIFSQGYIAVEDGATYIHDLSTQRVTKEQKAVAPAPAPAGLLYLLMPWVPWEGPPLPKIFPPWPWVQSS